MALSDAFRERLEQMEQTRNERLSLLQAEKEVQLSKSKILSSQLANIRSTEQKCLTLHQKIASQNCKISALRSEIDSMENKYGVVLQQIRDLRSEIDEIEEIESEKEQFYERKGEEMREFKESVEKFARKCRKEVDELRNCVSELKLKFERLQGNNGAVSNGVIAEAEGRKMELSAVKEKLDRALACNYKLRSQLQFQIRNTFSY